MAILAGGEASRTRKRARANGVDLDWPKAPEGSLPRSIGKDVVMNHPAEIERGIVMPVQVYPMFETAIRAAAAQMEAAEEAQRRAAEAAKDTVKGLRTVTRYEITDHKALLNWIAKNDRDAITDFINEWARKEHKACANADGLRVWTEKAAF